MKEEAVREDTVGYLRGRRHDLTTIHIADYIIIKNRVSSSRYSCSPYLEFLNLLVTVVEIVVAETRVKLLDLSRVVSNVARIFVSHLP